MSSLFSISNDSSILIVEFDGCGYGVSKFVDVLFPILARPVEDMSAVWCSSHGAPLCEVGSLPEKKNSPCSLLATYWYAAP